MVPCSQETQSVVDPYIALFDLEDSIIEDQCELLGHESSHRDPR